MNTHSLRQTISYAQLRQLCERRMPLLIVASPPELCRFASTVVVKCYSTSLRKLHARRTEAMGECHYSNTSVACSILAEVAIPPQVLGIASPTAFCRLICNTSKHAKFARTLQCPRYLLQRKNRQGEANVVKKRKASVVFITERKAHYALLPAQLRVRLTVP